MESNFNISKYMSSSIERIITDAMKASLKNPKETAFIMKYLVSNKFSQNRRDALEKSGKHIPPFLIASITTNCNLFCSGCYAREFGSCDDKESESSLKDERWNEIFNEASDLGISFIILAGGEPLMRKNVLEIASKHKDIIFPVFTNGTMVNEDYLKLFNKNRNLIPILSIEGDKKQTDERRGAGTYEKLICVMQQLSSKGILFGASITVTTKNINTVTSQAFIDDLYQRGCKVVVFVEYVPVNLLTKHLAPTDKEREILATCQEELRKKYEDIIFISFPGDEKVMDGCLAAGRGFFHINANGNVEPCPFSPYSDMSLRDSSIIDALSSPLFLKMKESGMLLGEHDGGCLLFEKEEEVKELMSLTK